MATETTKNTKDITEAALAVYKIGWTPFPLLPGSNIVAVDWEQWQADLTVNGIRRYWQDHPDHDLGFIEADLPDTGNR
jgi:hypothetical protein